MTPEELTQIDSGGHWLCRLASELGTDATKVISELRDQDWTPAEVALSLMDSAFGNDVTRSSVITVRVWPFEKRLILRACAGSKLEEFVREAVIEKAMKEGK